MKQRSLSPCLAALALRVALGLAPTQAIAQPDPTPAIAASATAALRYGSGSWRFLFMVRPTEGNQAPVYPAEIRGILRSAAMPEFTALKWFVLEASSRGEKASAAPGKALATVQLLTEPRGRAGSADSDFTPLHDPVAQPREVREVVSAWARLFLGGMPELQAAAPAPGAPLLDFSSWLEGALASFAGPELVVRAVPVVMTSQVPQPGARNVVSGTVDGEARVVAGGIELPLRVSGRCSIDAASGMPLFTSLRISGKTPDGGKVDVTLLMQLSQFSDP